MNDNKIILLGLDGATWKQIKKFVSEDETPNLYYLIQNSANGILQSNIPFTSKACWLSILTGTNAGKHGVPHHIIGGKVEVPLLYEILKDKKQIIVNDAVTFPPLKIDGVMITGGFSTPSNSREFVYPESVLNEIDVLTGGYTPMLSPNATHKVRDGREKEFYEELQKWGDNIIKISHHFSKKINWDSLAVFLENTDYMNHFFWNDDNYLKQFYKWLDKVIGEFLTLAQENNANLFIVSDHGGGPIKKHFLINSWLQNEGITSFQKPSSVRKILSKTKFQRKFIRQSLEKFHLRDTASSITPKKMKKLIPIEKNETGFVDKNSKIFSEAYNEITVNIEDFNEYEKTRENIIKKLLQFRDTDGSQVVLEAYKREEIFSGPYVKRAYDIQFVLNEGYSFSPALRNDSVVLPSELGTFRKGDHRPEGIFIAFGKDIKKNFQVSSIGLCDVAPTILHSLGYDIPSYMDGKVATEIFDKNSTISQRKITTKKETEKDFIKRKINMKKLKI